MDAHEGVDCLVVYICEGCQDGSHAHCVLDRLSPVAGLPGHGLSDVSWTDPELVECCSTWRCGDCLFVCL